MKKDLIITQEITKIIEDKGNVTPFDIVTRASNEESPLHKYFEWDDSKAAHEYRFWQARQLISSVKVVIEGRKVDAFVSLNIDIKKSGDRAYYSISSVMDDNSMYQIYITEALKAFKYWSNKYSNLIELKKIIDPVHISSIENSLEQEITNANK